MTKDEALQQILTSKQTVSDQLALLNSQATAQVVLTALAALSDINMAVEALIEAK